MEPKKMSNQEAWGLLNDILQNVQGTRLDHYKIQQALEALKPASPAPVEEAIG